MNLKNPKITLAAGLACLALFGTGVWLAISTVEPQTIPPTSRVSLWAYGHMFDLTTSSTIPADWLAQAGIDIQPADQLLIRGLVVDPQVALPFAAQYHLQYQPAAAFELIEDGQAQTLVSSSATLGEALWEAGQPPQPGDWLSTDPQIRLRPGLQVERRRARPLTIEIQGLILNARSSALITGEALADAGISLQGLDYSIPGEGQPLPGDGRIRVVRVTESVSLQQAVIPYNSSFAPDPNLELDQRSVMTPGQYGVKVSRERVRYEDGQEVNRQTEAEWTASQAVDEVLGYGTQVVTKSADTPDGVIEYYRAMQVYATSYSPCRQGLGRCSWATSSGTPLAKGVIAVRLSWYRALKGTRVYIPGYGFGIIADVGGGIPGRYWIDLGYGEEDFVNWSQYTTIYFLTPAPASVPALLPQ